jgi:UDP-N-acetylmuramate dehydrogenase
VQMEFQEYVPLKNYTSYKIGGPAQYFCEPASATDIKTALNFARAQKIPVYIMGNGTNLLVSDAGVSGLVIRLARKLSHFSIEERSVRVGIGLPLDHLISRLARDGWGNFESLAGIPGTVGGGIFMNAGAHGVSLGEFVRESLVMDLHGNILRLPQAKHNFNYRSSIFQHQALIVLETKLAISAKPKPILLQTIANSKKKRSQLPLLPSCGSTFRNPAQGYAGKIIEDMGLKGAQVGRAQISPVHANFIVNLGGAKANDVYSLIRLVQKEAADRGIEMLTEVRLWGEFDIMKRREQ